MPDAVFIYDWDDTILCTTYLSSFQFLDIGPETKALLEKLDECSQRLLERSLERGEKIFIITNAAKGWVEYSSKLYLPRTYALLIASHIKIISARSMFGQEFPNDFARWKIEAFKSILSTIDINVTVPPLSWSPTSSASAIPTSRWRRRTVFRVSSSTAL
jgi:hypothetical protein